MSAVITVGLGVGAAIALSAHLLTLDRNRSLYPTILIVVMGADVVLGGSVFWLITRVGVPKPPQQQSDGNRGVSHPESRSAR